MRWRQSVQKMLPWTVWFFLGAQFDVAAANPDDQIEVNWFERGQPTALVDQALAVMQAADLDGLDPEDYQVTKLRQDIQAIQDASTGTDQAQAIAQLEHNLMTNLTHFFEDLSNGRVKPQEVHHKYDVKTVKSVDAQALTHQALLSGNLGLTVEQAKPMFPLYGQLRQWLAKYRALGEPSAWDQPLVMPRGKKLTSGQPYQDLARLKERLVILGDLYQPASTQAEEEPDTIYDTQTEDAIKRFQARHGLTVDGVIGPATLAALQVSPKERAEQIALSMERLRWTPLTQGERVLVVNIPGYTLYGYEVQADDDVNLRLQMPVIVGRAGRLATPVFDETMRYIEFSPYWNIPISIARGETMPAIERDPDYFTRQQMEFVSRDGKVYTDVTPDHLEAVQRGEMRIRQRPGRSNALGGVKFIFPNSMNIYMHHTPSTGLFARSQRDFSHGCIRVEDPVALAQFVLQNDVEWDEARIRRAMNTGRSVTLKLKEPVPVVIAYSTVMIGTDGQIAFYPDIYGHDKRLSQALNRHHGK
ncbi:L,D-transpeptidase family protein [Orrella sp. 11846]|uniref:L,D-transpeptidase family protein n=1 Tax=Orrella sp. 11846 TaxID=3409913 RepID=UPI003B5A6F9B